MAQTIPGFAHHRVTVADGVELWAAVGGSGPPVVLLHGFPQTHLMWRHVAADLSADHTVICPDLRGYGDSDKPREEGPDTYSKRTMAADVVALAGALSAISASRWPATTAERSSPSAPGWTTRAPSPTWPAWTSCRRSTCGRRCTARPPRSGSTCI